MAPRSPITIADVAAAVPLVMGRLDDEFFHVRFEKATPAERRYMAAMADTGDGPYRARDVVKRLGSSSGTSVHRDSLIKKGLIFSPDFGSLTSRCLTSPRSCVVAIHSSHAWSRRHGSPAELTRCFRCSCVVAEGGTVAKVVATRSRASENGRI